MIDAEFDSRTPWTPPGLRLPQVGDRVVVRLGGECPSPWHVHASRVNDDGAIGEVTTVHQVAQPHRFGVSFSPYLEGPGGGRLIFTTYAAIELEILADDDGR